jgi:hypothetical protein
MVWLDLQRLRIISHAIMKIPCGNSSVVERHLPKVNVVGSSPISRFFYAHWETTTLDRLDLLTGSQELIAPAERLEREVSIFFGMLFDQILLYDRCSLHFWHI